MCDIGVLDFKSKLGLLFDLVLYGLSREDRGMLTLEIYQETGV